MQEIETLKRLKQQNQYNKYIEHIRFPNFKNLLTNTRIDFEFPLTFLVGKNGSGKSSILQALYGCPSGKNIGDFWFETDLDPILDNQTRNRYIYGYKINNEVKEVLYQRAPRDGNPDYWETSRPLVSLNMRPEADGSRISPINMEVEYFDFRSDLNAFDRYFHYSNYKPRGFNKKQDVLRFFSRKIKSALENSSIEHYYNQQNEPKISLDPVSINSINNILNKNYSSIELIKHNFYSDWGYTIRMIDNDLRYSEAFAGSGESTLILMIYKLSLLNNNSLVILDEPETSLHPGAQKKLTEFLLSESIRKRHQFVISTHSSDMISKMPDEAIKVVYTNNQKFEVLNSCNYKFAFSELGITDQNLITILCEDVLAKKILESVLDDINPNYRDIIRVKISSGGSKEIYKRIVHLMDLNQYIYIYFDGDENRPEINIEVEQFTVEETNNIDFISTKILEKTGVSVRELGFSLNSNSTTQEKIIKYTEYLNFLNNKVKYLPLNIPEEIIWNEDYAKQRIYQVKGIENHQFTEGDSKNKFYQYNIEINNNTDNYNAYLDEFIQIWKRANDENYQNIYETLRSLI